MTMQNIEREKKIEIEFYKEEITDKKVITLKVEGLFLYKENLAW